VCDIDCKAPWPRPAVRSVVLLVLLVLVRSGHQKGAFAKYSTRMVTLPIIYHNEMQLKTKIILLISINIEKVYIIISFTLKTNSFSSLQERIFASRRFD
jgi:hypothetical protein